MKKLLVTLCLVGTIFTFVGCGAGSEKDNDVNESTVAETETEDSAEKGYVKMPKSSEDFLADNKEVDEVVQELKDLGFTEIEKDEWSPSEENFRKNVFYINIKTGIFKEEDKWEAGDEFKTDSLVRVTYNEKPLLTPENSDSLNSVITNKDSDPELFANMEDGRYVEFDGCVLGNIEGPPASNNIITVTGGDYSEGKDGPQIWIGDKDDPTIDYSVVEGDNVKVVGKIDESWTKYYDMLYIETISLQKR